MASRDLLEDDDIRRWHENLARASGRTAIERLRILARLCRLMGTTPGEIVEVMEAGNSDRKGFEDRFMDFLGAQREAGRTASYLGNYVKTVRSWLNYHGLSLKRTIKLGNMRETPTVMEEKVPTVEQLRDLLAAASPRGRTVIALIAFSGVRPGVLGDYRGVDGLRVGDLPELAIEGGRVVFSRSPTQVRVRAELSKVAHSYLTFLGEEGVEHVRRYLQSRLDNGEDLGPDSPIIRCAPGFEDKGKRAGSDNRGSAFIVTANITGDVRQAIDKCRWQARPYVLRRYFDTQLLNASWKGLVPRDWVTYWAGHKGDIEHVYTLHKGLPDGLIEEMREAYAKAEPYLSTVTLKQEGRQIAEADVSSEKYSVTVTATSEKWAHKTDEEKLLAFITQVAQRNDLFKSALREALRE